MFERGRLSARQRLLLDVGEVAFERLGAVMSGEMPSGLSERQRDAWDLVSILRSTFEGGWRVLTEHDAKRAEELGLGSTVGELAGHTYLLRTALSGDHDDLVAFTAIGEDETGISIAWRVLRSWPVEQPPPER